MIDIAKLAPVGAILIICFLPGLIVKRTPLDNKIAIGIFSGLSAVGAHQLLKQLLGTKEDGESE